MPRINHYFITTVLTILFSLPVGAQEELSKKLFLLLPGKISKVQINKNNKKDIEKILGTPDLVEKNKFYYVVDGLKYGLELTFDQEKLQELHFTFVKNKPAIDKLNFKFETSELTPFPRTGSASGKYFILSKPDAEMIIDPVSRSVYSIRIRK